MSFALRPYQIQAVSAIHAALDGGEHPLCVLPTGAGKSLVLAQVLRERNVRALVLSHVAELLDQDIRTLRRLAPDVEASLFVAGLGEKDATARVVFGSVQSVVRSLALFRTPRSLLVVDEAHLCPRKADAMYSRVFAHFMQSQRLGLTATPKRLDSGALTSGDGAWFSVIAHEVEARELIAQGYLSPLVGVTTALQADLSGVATRGGDFVQEQAAAAVQRTLALPEAVAKVIKYARARKAWLVFAASVEHATAVAREFARQGVDAELVTNATTPDARELALSRFRAGEVRALVNVGVLTTGFDAPLTDCIVSMRPTQSEVLWQQILGRGMRLAARKENCLLLDFVGNLDRLGGVGCVTETFDMRKPEARPDTPERVRAARKRREAPELFDPSSEDPMVNGKTFVAEVTRIKFFPVKSRRYPGKEILLATYDVEDELGRAFTARTFLCVEYPGSARYMAARWFAQRGLVAAQVPTSARDALALARTCEQPHEVLVRYDPRLACYVVDGERFARA